MFTKEEIKEVLINIEVLEDYEIYKQLYIKKEMPFIELEELVSNISGNECGNYSLLDSVLGVLDSFLFSATHTVEEIIEIANSTMPSRMEQLREELSEEDYKRIEIAASKLTYLPPLNLTRSMEEEFYLTSLGSSLQELLDTSTKEELGTLIMDLIKNNQTYRTVIKSL